MTDGDGGSFSIVNIMSVEFLRPYISLISLLAAHHVLGSHALPVPKRPKVYAFGLPPLHVNVSIETIHFKGVVQYDLLYNRTCCDACYNNYSEMKGLCEANLSPLDKCHFVENQDSQHTKVLSCIICNSMENCKSMEIEEDNDLCLCLKARNAVSSGNFTRVCIQRRYRDLIVYPPPKSVQLFTTEKGRLTVSWERPDGLALNISAELKYKILLQMQNHGHNTGNCNEVRRFGKQQQVHTYTFSGLIPWTNYSVTICCGVINPVVNVSSCTCGGPNFQQYTPVGPIFQRTLPEEPTEAPQLQPCKAMCHGGYLTATLQWQASNQQVWNGIPTKSVITVWNSTVAGAQVNKSVFTVPLPEGYNGSLVSYTIPNLSSAVTYKVQFCSNGGCGPAAEGTLSCENCLIVSGPSSAKHDPGRSSLTIKVLIGCFSSMGLFAASAYTACLFLKRRQSRERIDRPPLNEVLSDLIPDYYDQIDFSDLAPDSGPYRQVIVSDRQCLVAPKQTGERV